jgi:lysyl-tRNA synthetase class 2
MMQPIAGGALARPFITHHNTLDMISTANRAGAVLEGLTVGGMEKRLRNQPQLPQRGDLDAAQPRVHDARVLRAYVDYQHLMRMTRRWLARLR